MYNTNSNSITSILKASMTVYGLFDDSAFEPFFQTDQSHTMHLHVQTLCASLDYSAEWPYIHTD